MYNPNGDSVEQAGLKALHAEAIMRVEYDPDYTGSGSIAYPSGFFADRMRDLAQLIKLDTDLSLRIATIDFGGWDTHTAQNNYFNNALGELSQSIEAFLDDLAQSGGDYFDRTTIIMQSEFGRRAFQNYDEGTDHGSGNIMLALGKPVTGGAVYGTWPGLYPGSDWVNYVNPNSGTFEPELFEGAVATTTDFRHILGEFLMQRCQYNTAALSSVFPGFTGYSPLGIFKPLSVATGNVILSDNFE